MANVDPGIYLPQEARVLYRTREKQCRDFWSFWVPMRCSDPNRGGCAWYVPIRWDGTTKLMFVGAQPSSRGHFPSPGDKQFWDIAVSVGLAKEVPCSQLVKGVRVYYEGPFVTELVPKRAKVTEPREPAGLEVFEMDGWLHE